MLKTALLTLALSLSGRGYAAPVDQGLPPLLDKERAELRIGLPQEPWKLDPDADGPPLELSGALPNFARVSDAVFRSGQPEEGTLAQLAPYGVRTILDLRLTVEGEEAAEAAARGIGVAHVPMNGIYSPTFEQVDRALEVLTDPRRSPVLVHCHYGHDRTGVVIAAYRVVVQRWPIEKAAAEARSFHCCAPFFLKLEDYLQYYVNHRGGQAAR